ncbi:transport and Golgi organization protein 6 homolog isoform 2-T2 [Anomaloglossus baeobatrachus]|uniref:transport and Golgi organization protein 6 homolog isoform X2 n=1 Tax=Anomaloglossus baeobatrachus TaxID=238106 RepID=UPI003F50A420
MAAACVTVSTVVEALKVLLTPRDSGSSGHNTGKQAALLATLQFNVSTLEEELKQVSKWEPLLILRERVSNNSTWLNEGLQSQLDPSWKFCSQVLLLLLCLKECMIELAKSFQPSKPNLRTPEAAPPLSPDTLSIAQQKTVQSALQFVVSMGICPYLLPGIGLPLQHRSEFGALVCSMVSCDLPPVPARRLYITCMCLLDVSRHCSLGSLFFTQHLGDFMAGLCQLGYCPTKGNRNEGGKDSMKILTECERVQCKEAFRRLLDQLYQPLVIRELLILQGGLRQGGPHPSGAPVSLQRPPAPTWLRRLTGQLLSERLMRPNGVQAVVRGILEDAGAGVAGGREAEAAAGNWKKCDMIARVLASCPQQSITVEDYYCKVCPQILDLLHIQNSITARQFQRVATETFLKMARDQPQLAEKYLILPMLNPLLYCTSTEEKSPVAGETLLSESVLSQCIEDIVKVFVVGNDPSAAILNYSRQVLLVIFSLYCFARQNASHVRGDDDDDALYERVTSEQWKLQCLVDLLSINPHTGLAADFFLYCLKRLTPITTGERPHLSPSPEDSLLDIEHKLTLSFQSQEKPLQLLQVLSVLCERISDSIFTDVKQVTEFALMTLERACTSLATSEGGTVASQTLNMTMGLIAAMLGAVELNSTDFGHLKKLIPVLEKVMEVHPEAGIQELASELRVTIATHCAVPLSNRTTNHCNTEKKETKQPRPRKDSDLENIQEILSSAKDPDVPTRAASLRFLSRLLEQRHPQVIELREQVMQLFLENLEQGEPFVYLSAIQGIAILSRDIPERILPILLSQYESTVSLKGKLPSPETRMKVGEALMRCTRTLGDMVLQHRDALFHAFLRGCRDPDNLIRASSLSNLGDLCKQLQFSLGPVIHEVTSCLSAVVHTDPEAQVRRAAIHVIVLLLRGLSERATEVLRDVLLDLYRLLKYVVQCERDSVSVLHAQLGLEELDSIMRAFLFPAQKLEKKIVVLP